MTPITNISVAPSTNASMSTSQLAMTYATSGILQKQQSLTDLSINKPPSSTLVDLLKQRRSPPLPPPPPPPPRSSIPTATRQQRQNSIVKQPRKPTKKSQAQIKRLAVNNDNHIQVNFNYQKYFHHLNFI